MDQSVYTKKEEYVMFQNYSGVLRHPLCQSLPFEKPYRKETRQVEGTTKR